MRTSLRGGHRASLRPTGTPPGSSHAKGGAPAPWAHRIGGRDPRRFLQVTLALLLTLVVGLPCGGTTVEITTAGAQDGNSGRSIVRTANGDLYAVILQYNGAPAGIQVFESTNGGATWVQQDAANEPAGNETAVAAAIDGNGLIQIAYTQSGRRSATLMYATFSTASNTFSSSTSVGGAASTGTPRAAIAVDSNSVPHILYTEDSYVVDYVDRVGGKWNSPVHIYGDPKNNLYGGVGDILIDQSNIPEIAYLDSGALQAYAAIGNANRATSFTSQGIGTGDGYFSGQAPSIALDSSNSTWVAYVAPYGSAAVPAVVEHVAGSSWATWSSPALDAAAAVDTYFPWGCVGLAVIGTTPYIVYLSAAGGSLWQTYNGSSWSQPVSLYHGSEEPELRWSEYFDYFSSETDALLTNGAGTFWAGITASISGLSPASGSPGTSVTLNGLTFGPAQRTSTLTFNGVAASPTAWTNTQIVAPVPAGATSGPVEVAVYSVRSNPVMFTVQGSLAGTVTSAGNGSAISGATVQALLGNTAVASATTASNGAYSIPNLFAGSYDLRFTASGFGTAVLTGKVVASGATTTVNASLGSPGTISGTVTQFDGVTPIPGAVVTAAQGADALGSGATNSSGSYSIATLGAGTYTVLATASGYATGLTSGVAVTPGNATTENFSLSAQSPPTVSYFYDELGRLIGVSNSQSNTATYSYDSAGNLLSVAVNPSTRVSIAGFDPGSGSVGATVTISGTGFSPTASQDTVAFNGTPGTITSASATQLVATVPSGATTGPIKVTAPGGSATSSSSFTVK